MYSIVKLLSFLRMNNPNAIFVRNFRKLFCFYVNLFQDKTINENSNLISILNIVNTIHLITTKYFFKLGKNKFIT